MNEEVDEKVDEEVDKKVDNSGGTLCRDNRRLIGTPLIVIAR